MSAGALFLYNWATLERGFEARSVEQAASIARHISDAHAKLLGSGRLILDLLSEVPEVQDFDPIPCHRLLASLREKYPGFMSFGVFHPNGDRVCGSRQTSNNLNVASRSWFRAALETRSFAVGQYQIGLMSGRPCLGLGKPLVDTAGNVQGVVYAALDLDGLAQRDVANILPEGGTFLLADRAGTILSVVPQPALGSPDTGVSIAQTELFQTMKSSPTGSSRELPGLDGRSLLYYFFNLGVSNDTAVYAAVGLPLEAGRAEAKEGARLDIAALGGVALATIAIGFLISTRMLVQPFQRLAAFSHAVGEGDLGRRTGLGHWGNEVGELARNLDGMAESLSRHRAERLERDRLILETEEAGRIGSWQWVVGSSTGR